MVLNVGSLVLGVGAWLFAGLAIAAPNALASCKRSRWSFCLCAVSLVFQLLEVYNRTRIGDFSAIEDTIRAVVFASVTLLAVTVFLNAAAWIKGKKRS